MTTNMLKCSLATDTIDHPHTAQHILAIIDHHPLKQHSHAITTGMPSLDEHYTREIWCTDTNVTLIQEQNIQIAQTPDLLMLSCCIQESGQLAEDTRLAYETLLKTTKTRGYPYLLRAWNYIADINQGSDDDERYKQFCAGRYAAFANSGIDESAYPAASALGHTRPEMVIYLLSAKQPGIHIENPKQQSAYTYPRQYGSRSPSFARATVCPILGQTFISGTASITGHETLHMNDVQKQLELTLENIHNLSKHIETTQQLLLENSLFKVYIRHAADFPLIKKHLSSLYPNLPCLYLQADICRTSLLLEIEAILKHL